MVEIDENLKRALVFSFILNSALAFSKFYSRTYDSYTHMFFADHYRRTWFNTWEPKWYTGFTVTSYTPLAHQSLALLSYIVGLEQAYVIIVFVLMILIPVAVYEFSKVFVSNKAAGYSSIIGVFLPSTIQITYSIGQYPLLFGLIASLFTVSVVDRYLKVGSKLLLIQTLFLLGVVVSANFTMGFFLILVFFAVFSRILLTKELDVRTTTRRFILFLVVGVLFSAIVIYPFILFVLNAEPQAPVFPPHVSRTNVLTEILSWRFDGYPKLLAKLYGITILLIPLAAILVYRRRRLLPLFVLGVFFFTLSLGGTTILPQLVFGKSWVLLGYVRFALFAGVVFLPLFGLVCANLRQRKGGKIAWFVLFVLLILFAAIVGNAPLFSWRSENVSVEPIAEFLSKNDGWNWRYITLGFGMHHSARLSILTNSTTLDGFYPTARTLPILRNSGVAYLDSAKDFKNGSAVLETILKDSSQYSIKWVFCNDEFYEPLLNETGFTRLEENFGEVTVWEKENTPMVDNAENMNFAPSFLEYLWGIAPLFFLVSAFVLYVGIGNVKKPMSWIFRRW
ncbi:MAG: hypothetical protein ACE5I5_14330 [Candidatus Heimdallarchaeota archaeon]